MISAPKLLCLLAFLYALPVAAQPQEQMINIHGTAIYCRSMGQGEPVLFIHMAAPDLTTITWCQACRRWLLNTG